MASEQFSLCWDNFHKNMSSGMNSLLENEDLVDVTLAVEGKYLKAHKMVLSVCSPYFKELFKSNPCQHPIVFMKDVSYVAISDLLQFMYQGEVQVSQDNLTTFIKTAEALQIKGLTGDGNGSADADSDVQEKPVLRHAEETYKPAPRPKKQLPAPIVTTTSAKRPRLSVSSNDSQSALPQTITKTEPVNVSTTETAPPVQFKMEPYDQNQSVTIPDDGGDETFGDETLDDTAVDDTEDYSMMEGDEPQAGTSTDGAGEGQATIYLLDDGKNSKLIVENNKYIINKKNNGRPKWRCSQHNKQNCKSNIIFSEETVEITSPHDHPPTYPSIKGAVPQTVTLIRPKQSIFSVLATIHVLKRPRSRKLIVDNNEYTRNKKNKGISRWRCSQYKYQNCRSYITCFGKTVKMTSRHNHPPVYPETEHAEPQTVTLTYSYLEKSHKV